MSTARAGLVVISGPSGSGKSTLIERLRGHPSIRVSVSVTTRTPRANEVDGRDYHFVDRETFLRMKAEGGFVETNDVFDNGDLYGSSRQELEEALAGESTYLMEVDIEGARNLKRAGYDGVYVFIAPPSLEVLGDRLAKRGTDTEEQIARRLERAAEELREADADPDTVIIENDSLDRAYKDICALIGLTEPAAERRPTT